MPQNQALKDQVEKGFRTVELLDDRPDPKDGWHWQNAVELLNNIGGFERAGAGLYATPSATLATYYSVLSATPFSRIRSAKGLKILDVAFAYALAAGFTGSVDLTVQKTVYADNAAPSVTNLAFTYDAAHDTAGERATANREHLLVATLTDPEYQESDLIWYSAELTVVLTASAFRIRGAGMHFEHDYL